MGHLNKQQYERRRENAVSRNIKNEDIAVANGMTQEQAELISELCSLRHRIHSSVDRLVEDNSEATRDLIGVNARIDESGLKAMDFIPTDTSDYIDIDDINTLYETEEIPEDDEERRKWRADKTAYICEQWYELNRSIERYLAEIDKKYNTHFAPTGALRIF